MLGFHPLSAAPLSSLSFLAATANAEAWRSEQGVARNLARNLSKRQIQGCRVQTRTDPVPAGSNCVASVRTGARASAAGSGVSTGSNPLGYSATSASVSVIGSGAATGSDAASVVAGSAVSTSGFGLKHGGGRIRTRAGSKVTPTGARSIAGSSGIAFFKGIHNPTDEEMMLVVVMAAKRRRLTAFGRRL